MFTEEWSEYAVGATGSYSCLEFHTVSHVTHLQAALNIIQDGQIDARLVFDHSRLNSSRTLVVWVSPNEWDKKGYFYGHVRFSFDWKPLVADKNFYYVETMKEYNPHACRILITDQDHPELHPYDPSRRDGPWWRNSVTGADHFNGTKTLEFLLETDVPIASMRSLSFVKHSSERCSLHKDPANCSRLSARNAQARFVAGILSDRLAWKFERFTNLAEITGSVRTGWFALKADFSNLPPGTGGALRASDSASAAVARSMLSFYGKGDENNVKALASLFSNSDETLQTLETLAEEEFGDVAGELGISSAK